MKNVIYLIVITLCAPVFSGDSLEEKLNLKKKSSKASPEIKKQFERALKELKSSGIEQRAVQTGANVPLFKIGGKNISEYYKDSLLVIKFYRGHWCPYCMIELKEYEKFLPQIKARGAKLIALVPDTNKEIAKTKKKFNLTFPIFRDESNKIAKKFGIAFKLDQKISKLYQDFGIDLKTSQGNLDQELPMPGTYLINKKGEIIFAFIDADYTNRLDPRDLLKKFP